ncbi:MAG TPA: DUF748 domain-containing protein [Methylomirabilota bacterium]|nr:DUF748 domain-containing protein [Methylomirabilota bacterium]
MTLGAVPDWAGRLRRLVTAVPFLVTAGVLAVLAVAYTLAGFFLVPRLIATYVPRYVQEQLKRRAEIGEVRLNPLLFKVEIKHFRLQEADGQPLLGFDRLFIDFELSSLFRRAWTFAEIQLEAPRLDVVLTRDGRLNLADLIDALPQGEPAAPSSPAAPRRVLLRHAAVQRGSLSFTDLSGRAPQTATVAPINVELRNITTLPERRGPYAITANLSGGGVVGWEGEVSLVPLGSTGRVGIGGFPLATAWRFVQEDVALAEPAGEVGADARYDFTYRDGAASLKVSDIDVAVGGLVLARRGDKSPLLALEKIQLTGGRGDLVARELTIPEISVSRGRLAAAMARDGTVNWQDLVIRPQEAPAVAAPAAAPAEARPWRLAVEKVRVNEVALSVTDQSRAAPLGVDVAGLSLDLSARLESGPAGLGGRVEGLGLKLARVTVREVAAKAPVLSLDQVSVEGGSIDLGARRVAVSRVAVTGGTTTVVRAADGTLPLVTMLGAADRDKPVRPAAPAPARPAPAPAAKPWTTAVGKLDLDGHRLAVADRSVTPAVELQIDGIKVSARDWRSDGKKAFPFDASFRVAQGGRFAAKGLAAPDGTSAEARLSVGQLLLVPAQPYVARNAAVELRSGEVSTTGRLTYRAGRERAAVTYTGAADVNGVSVVESATGDPVLSWKSLHAETLRFGLAPDRLEIDEVRLAGLDGRLVIFQDKSLSLAKLMKPAAPPGPPVSSGPADAARAAPAAAPPAPTAQLPAAGSDATAGFPVVVERVRIDDSSMNFADLSLVLPFATRVHALSGVVVGLGSDPASRATMKLDGRVDEFGLVTVNGALNSFQPKVFTDIAVIFRNVPMSTLSPYSATFAGRRIQSGTMNLDLQYKVDRSALVGENKVVLQRLQLGERVESPGAMRLPLDLAIAILSDSEGRIDIALPVRGNVDHPEFSYGHLIWQALATVITKIVTSPFRALAGLFGGDAESLEAIAFEAGSDTVRPPERQKLVRVAEVLGKRPRLKLTVHGGYEAKLDGEALRSLRVRQDLAQRLGVKLNPGEDPGPVALDVAKTQRALEALLTARAGDKALDEFQAGYEKSTGKKAQRANPALALVGRGSPDRAFYEALFRRLVETAPLSDAELTDLGRRRGEATARALKEGAAPAAARVEVGDTEAVGRAERSAVPTRLELGAAGS